MSPIHCKLSYVINFLRCINSTLKYNKNNWAEDTATGSPSPPVWPPSIPSFFSYKTSKSEQGRVSAGDPCQWRQEPELSREESSRVRYLRSTEGEAKMLQRKEKHAQFWNLYQRGNNPHGIMCWLWSCLPSSFKASSLCWLLFLMEGLTWSTFPRTWQSSFRRECLPCKSRLAS